MLLRVLSSLVGVPLLVFCVFWQRGFLFTLGIAVVALVSLTEFTTICRRQGLRPFSALGAAAVLLFLLEPGTATPRLAEQWPGAIVTGLVLGGLLWELARRERAPVKNLGATLLGVFYCGWLFRYLILLRVQGAALLAGAGGHLAAGLPGAVADAGGWVVLLVFASTWCGDTAAYLAGRALGRHKLAPAISPGKTIEGAAGGLAGALAAALAMGALLLHLDGWLAGGLGVLIGVTALLGDLCESMLKRELQVKDFSGALPGHGGVLDRFDSLLFTGPVVYYVLSLVKG